MKLAGKVIIVTGACKGVGRAFALGMAREGASLVILSRAPAELNETARAIKYAGGRVLSFRADISKVDHVKEVVGRAANHYGKIDVLVNNAAVLGSVKPIAEIEEQEWDYVFSVNLRGFFLFSKAVVPYMIRQGGGKIINVVSGFGETGPPILGAYSIAKEGAIHLTRLLAEDLKPHNIKVKGLYHNVLTRRISPY